MRLEVDNWSKVFGVTTAIVGGSWILYKLLRKPSRPFTTVDTVGDEYNKWTRDGILEHYWGEHIHLGYYMERSWFNPRAWFLTNFIQATRCRLFIESFKTSKLEFTNQLIKWSGIAELSQTEHVRVLDVGCGIGGTTRIFGKHRPNWTITGVSISPEQIDRASMLAMEQSVMNVDFRCCDAMKMPFPDNAFDVVWSCESAEHMPDKQAFIKECLRVLKPSGKFVLATWCQRDDRMMPFSNAETEQLDFLYKEWCHPKFASLEAYEEMGVREGLGTVRTADWTEETLPAWRHSIFVGMWAPWAVVMRPACWWSTIREIVTLERMHCAFRDGLMRYGILTGTKLH